MNQSKKLCAVILTQLLFSFVVLAQLTPPGDTNSDGTNVTIFYYSPPPYVPGLKISIEPFSGTNLPINLLEADPAGKYDVYSASNLVSSPWSDIIQGTNGQTNFILTTPLSSTGFFRTARTDTPVTNAASMGISLPEFANTNLVTANISGGPAAALAVLVNNTNLADATWIPFSASPYVLLGTNDGTYDVWFGVYGSDGMVFWTMETITLDTQPPMLTITSPTNCVVSQPIIQLQGYCPVALSSISYDLVNIAGTATNQPILITGQYYDSNIGKFTTNYFQAFDVNLYQGANMVTIQANDLAGNTTTTNFNLFVDYSSKTNPPVVQLFWPQNGTLISGTNFTLYGSVSDPTAQISVQTVDRNDDTNVVAGAVGRDGTFWVQNLPLGCGTNNLTLTTEDVVGNITVTNINVFSSSVVVAVNPVTGGQTTITGTINTNDYAVWVNGVLATQDGEGNWEADNVPTLPNNAVVQVRVIPDSDNGGYGSGPGTNAISNSNLDNPSSSGAIDTEAVVPPPSGIYMQSYNGWYSESCSSFTESEYVVWQNGMGGLETINIFDAIYQAQTVTWPANIWPEPQPNGFEIFDLAGSYSTNSGYPSIGAGELGYKINGYSCGNIDVSCANPSGSSFQQNQQMKASLATGGNAGSTAQNLWIISASADAFLNPGPPDANTSQFPWYGQEIITSVPSQQITIGNLGNLDTNGNLYVVLPDNANFDVTPMVNGSDYYDYDISATEYTPGPVTVYAQAIQGADEPGYILDSTDCGVYNYITYGQEGYFQLTRTGDTTRPLYVAYGLTGTAEEGAQYSIGGDSQYLVDGRLNANGVPSVYFAPGVTNVLVGIAPNYDPSNYGSKSVILSILPGGPYATPNPPPDYTIAQTNATIDVVDSDVDYWQCGFSFPSGVPVPTNGIVEGQGQLQREDGVSDIGYGPFIAEIFLMSEAKLGTDFTFQSTNGYITTATNYPNNYQVIDGAGKVEPLYIYAITTGGCVGYHLTGEDEPPVTSYTTAPFTLTVLGHGSQPQTLKQCWMVYSVQFLLGTGPTVPSTSILGPAAFSILN